MKKALLLIITVIVSVFSAEARADYAIYINIPGVQGDSPVRPGWIEVDNFGFNMNSPIDVIAGRNPGHPALAPISIAKELDAASASLATTLVQGRTYDHINIEVRDIDPKSPGYAGDLVLAVELSMAAVKSFEIGAGGPFPVGESVTLDYAVIRWTPYTNNQKGAQPGETFLWNRISNSNRPL